jgi:hypothetical protein
MPGFAESTLQTDVLVGFNGQAREDRFAPIIVSIANAGTRTTVDVRLEVSWGSSLRARQDSRVFTRESVLGGGATRRLSFLVPLPSDVRSLDLIVSSRGVELTRQRVDLRAQVTRDRIVAVIASELALDSIAGLSDAAGDVRVVYPRIDDLPDAWAAWDGVDMVVVHDTYFQQLRAAQVSALERWVVTGGTVVVTGGAAGLQHAEAGLGRLLPVRVTGLTTRAALPSVARLAGVPRAPRGGIVLSDSRMTAGRLRAADGDLPLVVERRLGRGAVWFVAFDPARAPFSGWEGMLPLWRLMASRDRQATLLAEPRAPLDDPWWRVMIGSPALAIPSVLIALACAGLYCALLVPLLGGRFLRGMRSGLRIALLLAIPLLACGGSWIVFDRLYFRANPRFVDASLVELHSGDSLAMVTEKIGIVTARAGVVAISTGARDLPVDELSLRPAPSAARNTPPAGFAVMLGDEMRIQGVAVGRYGSRLLVLRDVVPMPITARATRAGSTLSVTLANASARALLGCFLWTGGRGYPLGEVPPNGVVSRSFEPGDSLETHDARVVTDPTRAALWHIMAPSVNGSVIAGWLDGSPLPLDFDGGAPVKGLPPLSLVLVETE